MHSSPGFSEQLENFVKPTLLHQTVAVKVMAVLMSKSQPILYSLPGKSSDCRITLLISLKPRPSLRVEGRSGFETRHIEGFQCKSQYQ